MGSVKKTPIVSASWVYENKEVKAFPALEEETEENRQTGKAERSRLISTVIPVLQVPSKKGRRRGRMVAKTKRGKWRFGKKKTIKGMESPTKKQEQKAREKIRYGGVSLWRMTIRGGTRSYRETAEKQTRRMK